MPTLDSSGLLVGGAWATRFLVGIASPRAQRPLLLATRSTLFLAITAPVIAVTTPVPTVAVAITEAKIDRRSAVTASVHPITAHRTVVRPDVPMPPTAPHTGTVSTVNLLDQGSRFGSGQRDIRHRIGRMHPASGCDRTTRKHAS